LSGYQHSMAVTMRSGEHITGVLLVLRGKEKAPFLDEQLPLLAFFGSQASLALELAVKQQMQRQLDVVSDRDRIGRELHEQVIQRLFAVGLWLQGVQPAVTGSGARRIAESQALRGRLLDVAVAATEDTELVPTTKIHGAVDHVVPGPVGEHAL